MVVVMAVLCCHVTVKLHCDCKCSKDNFVAMICLDHRFIGLVVRKYKMISNGYFSNCLTIVAEIQINSFINPDLATNHDPRLHLLPHKGRCSHPL